MRIAILNCTKKKSTYPCNAEEMYSCNYAFAAKVNFVKKFYDKWFIYSMKYGIIEPTTIIEPYNITLSNDKILQITGDTNVIVADKKHKQRIKQSVNEWLDNNPYKLIDFHIPRLYYNLVDRKPNYQYVKQDKMPPNTSRYRKAIEFDDLDESLKWLEKTHYTNGAKYVEEPKWFTHPEHGDFYGKAIDLYRQFPKYLPNRGCLYYMSVGKVKQCKGWRIKQ